MKNNRHIWEGWTVQDFIDDLTPTFELRIANAGFMGAWVMHLLLLSN